jgi:hypothetical protein
MRTPVVLVTGQGDTDTVADALARQPGTVAVCYRFDGQVVQRSVSSVQHGVVMTAEAALKLAHGSAGSAAPAAPSRRRRPHRGPPGAVAGTRTDLHRHHARQRARRPRVPRRPRRPRRADQRGRHLPRRPAVADPGAEPRGTARRPPPGPGGHRAGRVRRRHRAQRPRTAHPRGPGAIDTARRLYRGRGRGRGGGWCAGPPCAARPPRSPAGAAAGRATSPAGRGRGPTAHLRGPASVPPATAALGPVRPGHRSGPHPRPHLAGEPSPGMPVGAVRWRGTATRVGRQVDGSDDARRGARRTSAAPRRRRAEVG